MAFGILHKGKSHGESLDQADYQAMMKVDCGLLECQTDSVTNTKHSPTGELVDRTKCQAGGREEVSF